MNVLDPMRTSAKESKVDFQLILRKIFRTVEEIQTRNTADSSFSIHRLVSCHNLYYKFKWFLEKLERYKRWKNLPSRWEISVLGAKLNGFASFHTEHTWVFCLNSLKLFKVFQREIRLLFSVGENIQNWNKNDTNKKESITFNRITPEIKPGTNYILDYLLRVNPNGMMGDFHFLHTVSC